MLLAHHLMIMLSLFVTSILVYVLITVFTSLFLVACHRSALTALFVYDRRPSTFSGQRALNFVLENQNLIDKTLLINIRLVRVDNNSSSKKGK